MLELHELDGRVLEEPVDELVDDDRRILGLRRIEDRRPELRVGLDRVEGDLELLRVRVDRADVLVDPAHVRALVPSPRRAIPAEARGPLRARAARACRRRSRRSAPRSRRSASGRERRRAGRSPRVSLQPASRRAVSGAPGRRPASGTRYVLTATPSCLPGGCVYRSWHAIRRSSSSSKRMSPMFDWNITPRAKRNLLTSPAWLAAIFAYESPTFVGSNVGRGAGRVKSGRSLSGRSSRTASARQLKSGRETSVVPGGQLTLGSSDRLAAEPVAHRRGEAATLRRLHRGRGVVLPDEPLGGRQVDQRETRSRGGARAGRSVP